MLALYADHLLAQLTFLLSFFLLTFSLVCFENKTIPFQASCRKRQLNLALAFCIHFVLWYICSGCMTCVLALVVFNLVFRTKPRDWLGGTSLKWPILCWVGPKTLTLSTTLLVGGQEGYLASIGSNYRKFCVETFVTSLVSTNVVILTPLFRWISAKYSLILLLRVLLSVGSNIVRRGLFCFHTRCWCCSVYICWCMSGSVVLWSSVWALLISWEEQMWYGLILYWVVILTLQCFDAVGWAAGRASGL